MSETLLEMRRIRSPNLPALRDLPPGAYADRAVCKRDCWSVSPMIQTTAEEAETRLVDLINAAARGEEVFIAAAGAQGAQVVQLVAITPQRRTAQFGSARGAISMAEDFDLLQLPDL